MTSKERVLTTFAHREPDHVPCWLGASPEWKELARAYLKLEDDEALLRYIGDDFRRVFSTYAGPPERSPDQQLSSPEVTWRSPFDVERHGYGYGIPLTSPLKNATLAEVHAYSWPDPDWMDVSGIKADAARWGGEFAVLGGEWSPFWHDAIDLLDFDVLIYQMFDNPHRACGHESHRRLLPRGQPTHLRGERRRDRHLLHRQRLRCPDRPDAQSRPV